MENHKGQDKFYDFSQSETNEQDHPDDWMSPIFKTNADRIRRQERYVDSTGRFEYAVDPRTGKAWLFGDDDPDDVIGEQRREAEAMEMLKAAETGRKIRKERIKLDTSEFVVPAVVDGHPVQRVKAIRIPNCRVLRFEEGIETIDLPVKERFFRKLILPQSLQCIGKGSFSKSPILERAIIPSGEIEDRAFSLCPQLKTLELGNHVTTLGAEAFAGCRALKKIQIPDSVVAFGSRQDHTRTIMDLYFMGSCGGVFENCDHLKEVHIGARLREIPINPFIGCWRLRKIRISPRNKALALRNGLLIDRKKGHVISAVYQKVGRMLEIPKGITTIGPGAFFKNLNLRSVQFPESLKSIGSWAFFGCERLAAVNTVKAQNIMDYAFAACTGLVQIEIKAQELGRAVFMNCKSLKEAVICVRRLGEELFSNCEALDAVFLGDEVTEFADYDSGNLFRDCVSLLTLRLPHNITQANLQKLSLPHRRSDPVILIVARNSPAEAYARKYNFPYVYSGEKEVHRRTKEITRAEYEQLLDQDLQDLFFGDSRYSDAFLCLSAAELRRMRDVMAFTREELKTLFVNALSNESDANSAWAKSEAERAVDQIENLLGQYELALSVME